MIRLLLLFLSLNMFSDLLEREDIKEFIDMAVENSDLKRSETVSYTHLTLPTNREV